MYYSLRAIREENKILDAYEEWEYDEEQEAINLANSGGVETDTVPVDFAVDVPVSMNRSFLRIFSRLSLRGCPIRKSTYL